MSSSPRILVLAASLASVAGGGCFALFSLDDYGPAPVASDASIADVTVGERDDGGASDADAGPQSRRVVFVTSERFTGSLGGFAGADARCNAAASDAGLAGSFVAWLGRESASASSRVGETGDAIVLPNGAPVAASLAELADAGPKTPIAVTEKGQPIAPASCTTDRVWTNARGDGTVPSTPYDCDAWAATSGGGRAGKVGGTGDEWTTGCDAVSCSEQAHLYCFQK